LGYGGKVDLHSDNVVLDVKTTEFTEDKLPPGYIEQCAQLASYRNGLDLPGARVANVYVSTSVGGLVHIREWTEEELNGGLSVFLSALNIWKITKKYDGGAGWKTT